MSECQNVQQKNISLYQITSSATRIMKENKEASVYVVFWLIFSFFIVLSLYTHFFHSFQWDKNEGSLAKYREIGCSKVAQIKFITRQKGLTVDVSTPFWM